LLLLLKIEKLAPVASNVCVHHLRPRAGLVTSVSLKPGWSLYDQFQQI